ncbi:DUF3949 domain-containing protein [Paenibacillus sp. SC116]|uniref:DUF3949 domain-containing protein n=1 Tax=Paenibacillus sp. SC116 TaxID=2968986 RepID=UPI00215ADEEB|nr:DUF3949 domain-containing protein [Paenibacillus sp. SC116]MCR8846280.1 DUF3949 domain-containing protein [Paenibacillus sp. SC116]
MYAVWIMLGITLLYLLVLVPIQYRYLVHVKHDMEKSTLSQDAYYDSKPLWEQNAHYSMHNPLLIPANLVASLIIKWKHRN